MGHVVKEQEYVFDGERRRQRQAIEGMNVLVTDLKGRIMGMEEEVKEKKILEDGVGKVRKQFDDVVLRQ